MFAPGLNAFHSVLSMRDASRGTRGRRHSRLASRTLRFCRPNPPGPKRAQVGLMAKRRETHAYFALTQHFSISGHLQRFSAISMAPTVISVCVCTLRMSAWPEQSAYVFQFFRLLPDGWCASSQAGASCEHIPCVDSACVTIGQRKNVPNNLTMLELTCTMCIHSM